MTSNEYQNPLSPLNFPDPAVISFRGEYVAYATGESPDGRIFPIMTSPDAIHWTFRAGAMAPLPDPRAREYWAPEVAYCNGLFYLYYAVIAFGTPEHHLRVAISDSPLGPFEDQGLNLTPAEIFAIDAHPFQDDDGQWYLFYARDYLESPFIGTGTAVDRLVTMTSLSGQPARVLRPFAEWQLFERQRAEKGGVDWYTVEGPYTLKRRGQYVCLYSGGCWKDRDYGVAYAVSDVPMGPGSLEDRSYRDDCHSGGPSLLKTQPGRVIGPGHNSILKAPNNVTEYMLYHGWPADPGTLGPAPGSGRLLRLDRLEWHAGRPSSAGATITPQPAPPMPQFRDLFDRPDGPGLGDSWSDASGQRADSQAWQIRNGEAITRRGIALAQTPARENYLFAASLRLLPPEEATTTALSQVIAPSGHHPIRSSPHQVITPTAGLIAAEIETKERVIVALEPGQIVLRAGSGGDRSAPLPDGFRPEVYHHLLIERNAARIRVWLDGLVVLEGDYAPGSARVGLWSEAPAAFDGIAVTAHFADDFAQGEARGWWAERNSHWDVRDGALLQPESGPSRHEIAKGEALADWELNADLQLLSGTGAYGIRVRPINNGLPVEAAIMADASRPGTREAGGPDAGVESENTPPPPPSAQPPSPHWLCRLGTERRPLPESFDPSQEHHLRLEKVGEQLSLWLDGEPIAAVAVPADPSRFSLFTHGAAAAFRDVSFTGLA